AEVARAVRHSEAVSVALIDIDHFKQANDVCGHEAGDAMLVRVARCLSGLARAEDTLGRAGGDEFAWILPETTREQALVPVWPARSTPRIRPPGSTPSGSRRWSASSLTRRVGRRRGLCC